MFGVPLMEHDTRYDMAAEWIEIIKRLWTSDEEFDFEGKFYNVKRAIARPKPLQKPSALLADSVLGFSPDFDLDLVAIKDSRALYPAVMSAGVSPKGREFRQSRRP